MIIYPAIDLRGGKCVRLYQGDFAKATVYSENPVQLAAIFAQQGAEWLHIIDLDAAKNSNDTQRDLVKEITQSSQLKIQFGGGIRNQAQIESLLELGITRVIIGSLAVRDPALVKQLLVNFGVDKIVLAVDVQLKDDEAYVAIHGWQQVSDQKLFDLINTYQEVGLKHILCTDISRDGTLQGPNIDLYKKILKQFPSLSLQASGGVSSLADIKNLALANVPGVVVGRALYEEKFSLQEALTC